MSTMIDKLRVFLESKGVTIEKNKVVSHIKQLSGGVQVSCRDGQVYDCDRVIVTVPLGVLKKGSIAVSFRLIVFGKNIENNVFLITPR